MLGIAVGSCQQQRTCKLENKEVSLLFNYEHVILNRTWLAENVDWDGVAWNRPWAEGSW
jgi:hypothetical protein